jgi:hypothetical protein
MANRKYLEIKELTTESILAAGMKYYDLKKYWPRVKRHLEDEELRGILVRDFNKYTYGRWRKRFGANDCPRDFESCDWGNGRRGRRPAFWQYTKHGACHWLANFNLRLAMLTKPKRLWRIVTSQLHSTVWDGDATLFEFNFLAFGISSDECFRMANERHLAPGEYLKVFLADHYSKERV